MADRAQFMERLGMTPTPAPTNAVPLAKELTLAPLSADALNKQTEALQSGQMDVSASTSDFSAKIGARPGVPMDMESGISFMERLRTSFQPTPDEEVKALEAAYGPGKVRRNQYGWLIVEKPGADGKPTDVLVDPIGVDFGDLATIASVAPELAGGAVGALKLGSRAPGVLNAFKTLVGMAAGTAAAGAAKDTAVRVAESEPVQLGETAKRRGVGAGVDVAIGGTLGTAAKVVGKASSPFSNIGEIQFKARDAQRFFKDKYGVSLNLTPAEATGNSFLVRAESMEMQKPGASVPFEKLLKEREAQLTDLQRLALGGGVPDEEAAGQRALAALGAKTAPLEQNVQRAASATATTAQSELTAGIGAPVDKTQVGQAIRSRAEGLRTEFQVESKRLYDDVFNDPLTQTKNISGDELARDAGRLIDRLPSVKKQVPTGVLLPSGAPAMTTQDVTLKEFVPDGVMAKLDALRQGKGQQFRLDELMQMRREVDNAIAQGEAIPGYQTKNLTEIRSFLTDRISTGLKGLSPDLLNKWKTANDFYAKEVGKFKKAGIAEIFRDPEQGSYLGETALVDRVTGGGSKAQDVYRSYKEFFGATSPEVQGIQQAVRDEVFGRDRIEGFVDAKGFAKRITQLAKDAPTAFEDAFGPNAASLRNSARALEAAQGGTIPEQELVAAVNSGNLSGRKLQEMLAAQAMKDKAYRNELVKSVSEGNLKPDTIKPTEFVNRMVFAKGTQPEDLRGVVGLLQDRPEVLEDIRRLTFQKVLDDATSVAPTGKRTLVANDIEKTLSDENMVKRLQTALGSSTYEDLVRLKDFLKPGAVVQQAAKSAGGLSAGAQVSALVETGALRYVDRAIKNFFIATVYTTRPIRALISNNVIGPDEQARLVNYVIASTPFLEAVTREFTEEGARKTISALKQSIDRFSTESGAQGTNAAPSTPREQFMRRLTLSP